MSQAGNAAVCGAINSDILTILKPLLFWVACLAWLYFSLGITATNAIFFRWGMWLSSIRFIGMPAVVSLRSLWYNIINKLSMSAADLLGLGFEKILKILLRTMPENSFIKKLLSARISDIFLKWINATTLGNFILFLLAIIILPSVALKAILTIDRSAIYVASFINLALTAVAKWVTSILAYTVVVMMSVSFLAAINKNEAGGGFFSGIIKVLTKQAFITKVLVTFAYGFLVLGYFHFESTLIEDAAARLAVVTPAQTMQCGTDGVRKYWPF